MKPPRFTTLLTATAAVCTLAGITAARAAVVVFTDRALWQAAAGASSFTENLEGFVNDTAFRTAPLALSGFTIAQEGIDEGFRNMVDVAPLQFGDNNGTKHLSLFTNAPEGGGLGTKVGLLSISSIPRLAGSRSARR